MGMPVRLAIKEAGYSETADNLAKELLKNPNVQAIVAAEKAKFEREMKIERRHIYEGLMEAINMARTMSDPMTMIAGWRELAKMAGYYAPEEKKVTITAELAQVKKHYESLSDEELLRLVSAKTVEGEVVSGPAAQ